ncbi:anti-sigma F factor [Ammonifex thiophilus]|uniref:Anti-sigma F factor n=1 Tax=Ammonifex thiophilus TaxID=444093 RepID=A0A3D8P3R7_9THEO|nr:anti-sigma F factor [Ammonifex thiophilus]RDV83455.1 anti-sigma F factor [Ammonifex thiophilus]
MDNRFRLEILSRPENVGLARVTVSAFAAQLDPTVEELEEVKGAVSEAVSNAIVHGYQGRPDGVVVVEGFLDGDLLEVHVEDRGKGIEDVARALEPEYTTDPQRLGLGFNFMRFWMDEVEVESRPGEGTRVVMRKKLRSASKG